MNLSKAWAACVDLSSQVEKKDEKANVIVDVTYLLIVNPDHEVTDAHSFSRFSLIITRLYRMHSSVL